ncbi:Cleavage induced Hypothetical protein [Phytophthora palmivora]|uniref:MULE transposase domain-containing protein n=1 Tax=Phytophthora palmivora TaxID=4796 RepID=A0A2P4X5A3_9STRA|nr:Cleavage induced Hypothetical protein [Phytophthora palmivora]
MRMGFAALVAMAAISGSTIIDAESTSVSTEMLTGQGHASSTVVDDVNDKRLLRSHKEPEDDVDDDDITDRGDEERINAPKLKDLVNCRFRLIQHNRAPYSILHRPDFLVIDPDTIAHTRVTPDATSLPTKKSRGSRTVRYHCGYKYTKNWASNRKIVYRCSGYRNTKCSARLELRMPAHELVCVNSHTCPPPIGTSDHTVNVVADMKAMVDRLTTTQIDMSANDIWEQVYLTFYSTGGDQIAKGLTEELVVSRVFRIKKKYYGGDLHGVVDVPPLSMIPNTKLSFFQFHLVTPDKKFKGKRNRLIGWAHPALMDVLSAHSVTLFVDGTFRCVPNGFRQCVVVMAEDRARCLFVPVVLCLCTNCNEATYWEVLDQIIKSTENNMHPAEIVRDFEISLIKNVQAQFPNAEVIGCLFHFKQALRRKMKKLCIPDNEVRVAMGKGVLDMLTEGIKSRCGRLGYHYSKQKWRSFWVYVKKTWMERYSVNEWNVHGLEGTLVVRTNNPLKRFNRELNAAFRTHPDLPTFVKTIRNISNDYVRKQIHTTIGLRRKAHRALPNFEIPVSVELPSLNNADSDVSSSEVEDEVSESDPDSNSDFYDSCHGDDSPAYSTNKTFKKIYQKLSPSIVWDKLKGLNNKDRQMVYDWYYTDIYRNGKWRH